jgi:lipoprotein-anchoring transpeptidase ErfK/SrfK
MVSTTNEHAPSWAQMDIAKETATLEATPTPSFTATPAASPTLPASPTPEATSTPEVTPTALPTDSGPAPSTSQTNASAQELSQTYAGNKWILVDISEQHMYVYEGDTLVYSFVASTGMNNATRVGTFAVQSKIPNAYGSTWNIWMPDWLGIYYSGNLENGIHALPILPSGATLWAGFLGTPISYGCVVLGSYEAQLLYDWAEIGTPVIIQW